MNTKTGNRAQPNIMYSNVKGGRGAGVGGRGGGLGWGAGVGGWLDCFNYSSVCTERCTITHRILYRTVHSV